MAQTVTIIEPKKNGVWPKGEPKSVRDAYEQQRKGGAPAPVLPGPVRVPAKPPKPGRK